MQPIANYYELLFELEASKLKKTYLKKPSDEKALEEESLRSDKLAEQLAKLKSDLSKESANADQIRLGFIAISNGILKSFYRIEQWGGYYPDLNQGMVISGYLFGSIMDDYKTALITEGNYYPVPHFYMSQKEWPFKRLTQLIEETLGELKAANFVTQLDAIKYFEDLKTNIRKLITELIEAHII